MNHSSLNEILSHFQVDARIAPYGNGHINDTYVAEGGSRYILQRINTKIFKDPARLMQNIEAVTAHLRGKIEAAGGDVKRETLTVIPTYTGSLFYTAPDGEAFRVYPFIEDTVTLEMAEVPSQLFEVGKAFGKFQMLLSDFPADKLYETIPDFHNTPVRVENLKQAIKDDVFGRAAYVKNEIDFALTYAKKYADCVTKHIKTGEIPLRVTHNDTKINNILLDKKTGAGVCVIDLDTVMPGSLLYDFGDALRTGAATAAEDERDLNLVHMHLAFYKAFAEGFLTECAVCLTEKEKELLPLSPILLTYECGIRFLEDFLRGDTYFKIHRKEQNLERARTQFKMVCDMEEKLSEMQTITQNILK